MKTDAELLREYRREGDETAFRALVERHSSLVLGTALRRTGGDAELARETVQQVFVLLAKNAGRLYAGSGLAGWLHRSSVLVSGAVVRRERRRGRVMRRYEEHVRFTGAALTVGAGSAGAEAWTEVLPLVDEGLARLPEKDRHILFAHFWQGRTYQEIAASSASTEAAVQRRASRAFAKLSAWLRRRRANATAGVLTAGMASLSRTPSAEAAAASAQLTARALLQARKVSYFSTLRWRLREAVAFGKMKLAGGFLAGCLVALMGGAGFAGGRFSGRLEQAQRQLTADTAAARDALRAATDSAPPPTTPAVPRRSLSEILDTAAAHYRDGNDPVGPARGQLVLTEIRPEEFPAALELLAGQREDKTIGTLMIPAMIQLWGPAIQADEAVAWLMQNRPANYESFAACLPPALATWAARQPFAARDWCRANRFPLAPGSDEEIPVFGSVYHHFPPEALEPLWAELPALPPEEAPYAEGALANLALDPATRQDTRDKISAVPDEKIRANLLERAGEALARRDPEAAAAWLKELPLSDASRALKVRGETVGQFLSERPDLALRVFLESPADQYRDVMLKELRKHLSSSTR